MIWTMLAATAAAIAPTPEAEALGRRLAQAGTLAALAPMLIEKDVADLVKEHPALSAAEQDRLRATARRVAAADLQRLTEAMGHAYAAKLSPDDLRALVAAAESPAAARRRAVEPAVLASALGAVGTLDVKGAALAAFCRETGKACPKR